MDAGSGFANFVAPSAATVMVARGRDHARASRGCEGEKNFPRRPDLARRPRATFAGSAGTRERGKSRPGSASRTGEEGACDQVRRPTGTRGRLPRDPQKVAEYDVSRRPSMTRRFPGAFPLTTWHRPEFKSSMQSPMKTRFSKATHLCEAHDPKSHAPGVSSRPRHRAHRRAGKTHERSKGESSDMPPRGMSAEVRALSSAPLRRGAQIREMRSETRATRGG